MFLFSLGTSEGESVGESVGLLYLCKSHTGDLIFTFWKCLPGELLFDKIIIALASLAQWVEYRPAD